MANGDSIKAGNITTAYGTTDWVTEQDKDQFSRKPFVGSVRHCHAATDLRSFW